MKSLKTSYMGLELENPLIVGASNMVSDTDNLKRAEEQGAAAIVYKSLFEEQVQLEGFLLDKRLTEFNDLYAEMVTIHPNIEHAGPDEHLLNIRKAKESISIPLIASLNAVNSETWLKYAKLISETGADAIELNFYQSPSDFSIESKEIEEEQIRIVTEIKKAINIPVSVKLSPDYTNILNIIKKLDLAGSDAFVLFNSFFQPDIDIIHEKHIKKLNLSNRGDYRKSLRYAGLLYGNITADTCCSGGIYSGEDAVKLILSGASCVQVVSSLYKNGLGKIGLIRKEMTDWMETREYSSIRDFKGKLSKSNLRNNPFIYKRAQYVDLLLNSEEILGLPD